MVYGKSCIRTAARRLYAGGHPREDEGMAGYSLRAALRHLRHAAGPDPHGPPDTELLRRFLAGDAVAFEALVWRHGPMVLGVGRRVLRDADAAEDAFQATFLALARKAGSIARRGSVGAWLCRVAFRAALRARPVTPRPESLRDGDAPDRRTTDPAAAASAQELRALIDEELSRLPGRYRDALVLHHLGGRTCDEVA